MLEINDLNLLCLSWQITQKESSLNLIVCMNTCNKIYKVYTFQYLHERYIHINPVDPESQHLMIVSCKCKIILLSDIMIPENT